MFATSPINLNHHYHHHHHHEGGKQEPDERQRDKKVRKHKRRDRRHRVDMESDEQYKNDEQKRWDDTDPDKILMKDEPTTSDMGWNQVSCVNITEATRLLFMTLDSSSVNMLIAHLPGGCFSAVAINEMKRAIERLNIAQFYLNQQDDITGDYEYITSSDDTFATAVRATAAAAASAAASAAAAAASATSAAVSAASTIDVSNVSTQTYIYRSTPIIGGDIDSILNITTASDNICTNANNNDDHGETGNEHKSEVIFRTPLTHNRPRRRCIKRGGVQHSRRRHNNHMSVVTLTNALHHSPNLGSNTLRFKKLRKAAIVARALNSKPYPYESSSYCPTSEDDTASFRNDPSYDISRETDPGSGSDVVDYEVMVAPHPSEWDFSLSK
uniref:Uncharacterized protein n=1 Tax=Chionoecetes opilio bacilliform virus TaxID=1825681 RepID=A0A1Q3DLX4_9VIRU|nr:hypothetical protein [Chionoecetes opilio bacilliform virus]GAV93188.1 hypothetical protein SCV_065 [Chionoecetes opilio bacilliform virus]